ncbi:MAG: DoxX family protein [Chthoniobacter sp.]
MNTHPLVARASAAYALLIRGASYLQSPFLLLVRLYWGWSFFQTGKGKLSDLSKPTEYFASLHIPLPALNAVLAGATECFGGLLLLVVSARASFPFHSPSSSVSPMSRRTTKRSVPSSAIPTNS